MGKIHPRLDEALRSFVEKQKLFFVASAPLSAEGHVNVSPKGLDSFRILGANRVGYLDLVGSGIETVSHLRENGRIVFLFCAFEGAPRILRLHGKGRAVLPGDREWDELTDHFPPAPGARSIVVAEITRIADSCGFGVPLYRFEDDRHQLTRWGERKAPEEIRKYVTENNSESIDGLPGLAEGLRPID